MNQLDSRMAQTLNHFYNKIFERVPLSLDVLVPVTQFLLGCIIRRVQCTSAANFIMQLPKAMQDDLLSLPAGPDRSVTPEYMIESLSTRFNLSREIAAGMIRNFFPALRTLVDPKEIDNLLVQLPEDFRALFEADSERGKTKAAA